MLRAYDLIVHFSSEAALGSKDSMKGASGHGLSVHSSYRSIHYEAPF